jgi:hypothetical protein
MADGVAERVARDRAGHPGHHGRRQRHPALVGEHAAEHQGELTGDDEPQQGGGLQRRQSEHHHQDQRAR